MFNRSITIYTHNLLIKILAYTQSVISSGILIKISLAKSQVTLQHVLIYLSYLLSHFLQITNMYITIRIKFIQINVSPFSFCESNSLTQSRNIYMHLEALNQAF